MADHLSLLEDKLDRHYAERRELISQARSVPNWDDYNFRAGYLEALRDIGGMIKEVRRPDSVTDGEIPSVLEESNG